MLDFLTSPSEGKVSFKEKLFRLGFWILLGSFMLCWIAFSWFIVFIVLFGGGSSSSGGRGTPEFYH
jgi:hypothetical protein